VQGGHIDGVVACCKIGLCLFDNRTQGTVNLVYTQFQCKST